MLKKLTLIDGIESLSKNNQYLYLVKQLANNLKKENWDPFIEGWNFICKDYSHDTKKILDDLVVIIHNYVKINIYDNLPIKLIDLKLLKHINPKTEFNKPGSHKWHIDNHPDNIVNVIVYLSEVGEHGGGMEYCTLDNIIVKCEYVPPMGGKDKESFVQKNIDSDRFKIKKITGNLGHTFIFNNCIVHRAGNYLDKDRDALLLQFEKR